MDRATTAVLQRLRRGPASTVELQAELYATHVAKQVYDLRAAGYLITTTRLPNGVAQYRLVSEPKPSYADLVRATGPVYYSGDDPAFVAEPDVPVACRHGYGLRLAQDTPNGPEYDWANCMYCGAPRTGSPVGAGTSVTASGSQPSRVGVVAPAPSRAPVPQFGDPALLREMRPKGRR